MCKSVDRLLSQMWYKTVSSCKRREILCTKCQMAEWFNSMETNFIIRPRSRKRRRRKKEMTNKVIPRTAASRTPLLAIKKMWPKYNLLRIKYIMMNLIMKLINSIIIRIQKNKTQIIPRPIRIQNVIEQFRKAHIFLVRILHFIVKFSFSEKAIKFAQSSSGQAVPNQFGLHGQMVLMDKWSPTNLVPLDKWSLEYSVCPGGQAVGIWKYGEWIDWDHLSRGTKYLGTICPWVPNLAGTVCPRGSISWGSFV